MFCDRPDSAANNATEFQSYWQCVWTIVIEYLVPSMHTAPPMPLSIRSIQSRSMLDNRFPYFHLSMTTRMTTVMIGAAMALLSMHHNRCHRRRHRHSIHLLQCGKMNCCHCQPMQQQQLHQVVVVLSLSSSLIVLHSNYVECSRKWVLLKLVRRAWSNRQPISIDRRMWTFSNRFLHSTATATVFLTDENRERGRKNKR